MQKKNSPSNSLLPTVVLTLVVGSLGLAIVDENYRPIFADLAKVGIGSYIGWMMPKSKT